VICLPGQVLRLPGFVRAQVLHVHLLQAHWAHVFLTDNGPAPYAKVVEAMLAVQLTYRLYIGLHSDSRSSIRTQQNRPTISGITLYQTCGHDGFKSRQSQWLMPPARKAMGRVSVSKMQLQHTTCQTHSKISCRQNCQTRLPHMLHSVFVMLLCHMLHASIHQALQPHLLSNM
jgi:hypothetical protein